MISNIPKDEDYLMAHELATRVEVIDGSGRAYMNYNASEVVTSAQDQGRTLKVFITKPKVPVDLHAMVDKAIRETLMDPEGAGSDLEFCRDLGKEWVHLEGNLDVEHLASHILWTLGLE